MSINRDEIQSVVRKINDIIEYDYTISDEIERTLKSAKAILEDILKTTEKETRLFKCASCGWEFSAGPSEYLIENFRPERPAISQCPKCRMIANEFKENKR